MLANTGVPTKEELQDKIPTEERLAEGPVAIIECFQQIPCDPCYHSCSRGAIKEFSDINNIPKIDNGKCTGCSVCVSSCPGLAIFVVDKNYKPGFGLVRIPYEFLPRPQIGDRVDGLNRAGAKVCDGEIIEIRDGRHQDKTAVVGVKVPVEYLMEVRNMRVGGQSDE